MLDGQVGGEEKQGDKGSGGEERSFPLPEGSGLGREREGVEVFFITQEGVFGGTDECTHGRGRGRMEGKAKRRKKELTGD